MRRLALLSLGIAVACSDAAGTPVPVRAIDLGDGTVATLSADGALVVTRDGVPLLRSAAGSPLLSRSLDAAAPDDWHDPATRDAFVFERIADGSIVFESPAPGVLHVATKDDGAKAALVSLALEADDGFWAGTGERFDHVDPRGTVAPMHMAIDGKSESGTNERHVPIPFLVSSNGWGLFVESREAGAFDCAKSRHDALFATFEGKSLDVTLFFARDPLEVVAAYTRKTGLPRKLPRWALGPMYWRNEWTSDAAVLADAKELRTRHIPTTTLWIDNPWETSYNTFRLDPARFLDAPAMMNGLAALGYRTVAWSTPYLENPLSPPADEAQQLYGDARAKGVLVMDADHKPLSAPGFDSKAGFGMLDFSTEAGLAFWAGLVGRAVGSGFSGFKLDYGEDLIPELFNARFLTFFGDGSTGRTARLYPLGYHTAYQRALDATTDGIVIVRASSWGDTARSAVVIWPGDLDSDLSRTGDLDASGNRLVGGLPACLVAAQSLAVSGFPTFGSDTGGFRMDKPTKDTLLRWAEHTALSMVMQLGGGGDTHAPWTYDEETSALYKDLATLHNRLVPYLAGLLSAAEARGAPTVRPVPLAYPNDLDARYYADDEYLLGPDLLVAPVLVGATTTRKVHVPPGRWIGWWDGAIVDGPVNLDVPAPYGKPPLFARAGAVVPLLPDGIDTLANATDPSVVTADARATTVEARAWIRGSAQASYLDGSTLVVDDESAGLRVRFAPGATATSAVLVADVRSRTGMTSALTHVVASGAELPRLGSEGEVRHATTSAYFLDDATLVLRLAGSVDARVE